MTGFCASAAVLAAALAFTQGPASRERYVQIAEGLTSATSHAGIRAAVRMFSAPDMAGRCERAGIARRLSATRGQVRLVVGRPLPLTTLAVVAFGPAGEMLPDVPIAIEVQEVSPAVLDLRSDRLEPGPVPIRPGVFGIRVRTVCEGPRAETTIEARVVPERE